MNDVRAFLVGAGPGDPGLITRRGLELLRTCDVVLFDRLVAPALVDEAPETAERHFVGKIPGEIQMPQAAIDALIVSKARAGKRVVRLKGGDPFVFGRGADEGQALAAAGIAFEIVPGVSAATAVPALAGIPVTHGGLASSFAVITGHEASPRPGSEERLSALAQGAETLVLLMGASSVADIATRLIRYGRPRDEPVALVERGTTPTQRTVVATLETVAEVARRERIVSPVTTIVGPVVGLRDALAWFEKRPLFGRRIVVTRRRAQATSLVRGLEDLGAEVISFPTIEIVEPPSLDELDTAVGRLAAGAYDWVLFASSNSVERFFARLQRDHDARAFADTKVAAVGPVTAARMRTLGIHADLTPETFTGSAAAEALGPGPGRVLVPRPLEAPGEIARILGRRGWDVDEPVTYQTVAATPDPEVLARVRAGGFDDVVFTSGSTVDRFAEIVGPASKALLGAQGGRGLVCCIGPSTAAAAAQAGFRADVVPDEHTVAGLLHAFEERVARTLKP